MDDRIDVYCPSCLHRGKVRTTFAASDDVPWGACTRCGTARVAGTPPKGGTVGRPRKTQAEKIREHANALLRLADELDAAHEQ